MQCPLNTTQVKPACVHSVSFGHYSTASVERKMLVVQSILEPPCVVVVVTVFLFLNNSPLDKVLKFLFSARKNALWSYVTSYWDFSFVVVGFGVEGRWAAYFLGSLSLSLSLSRSYILLVTIFPCDLAFFFSSTSHLSSKFTSSMMF